MIKVYIYPLTALIVLAHSLFGQNHHTEEKRSTIVEVDGYAYLSEDKTMRDLREEAFANAKREALQRAQTYLQSFTKVENFTLTYDLIESAAEGYVKILESKDHGVTPDNRYHVWVKAEVEYTLKKPETSDIPNFAVNKYAPLTVAVWTEKKEYHAGEEVRIFLKGNKDFYARVVYQDASGKLLQLLPNPHRLKSFFKGGKELAIPEQTDGFKLAVEPPFGKEEIIVYASSAPLGEVAVENSGKNLLQIVDELENVAEQTRGIKIVNDAGNKKSEAEFYETRCHVITRKK